MTLANPSFVSASIGSTSSTLAVGGVVTYTATFAINQQAVDSGQVENSLVATASTPGGTNDVRDTSDDPSTNVLDDSTIVTLVATPTLSVSKSATVNDPDSNGVDLGDTITYTIVVTNTGDLTMSNVRVVDTLTDGNSSTLILTSGPTLISGNASSLAVNGALTYQATFVINQQSVDSGSAVNICKC